MALVTFIISLGDAAVPRQLNKTVESSHWLHYCLENFIRMGRRVVEIESFEWSVWDRLFDEFTTAIADMIAVQAGLVHAPSNCEPGLTRLDILLERAAEKKRRAKNALLLHIEDCPVSSFVSIPKH